MKNLTWRELRDIIDKFNEKQLDQTATVYVGGVDEFYPIESVKTANEEDQDVLDGGHKFMVA